MSAKSAIERALVRLASLPLRVEAPLGFITDSRLSRLAHEQL